MRTALAVILSAFLIDASAAATIEGKYAMACRTLEAHQRIDKAAGAGDRDGVTAIIKQLLARGECWSVEPGLKVRIEENSFPYACVAKFGTAGPCVWHPQREVNPAN